MKQYHIVDLFAGVGGLSYGFSQLPGFRILAANEIEKDIAAAYSLNHPGVKMLNCDIADLTKERLAGALGGQQVDIVVGGPPCQSYSTLGKRRMDDRANLFLQYKRILQILQPQAFIFENVTGILSMDHGRLFQRVESEFRALGYDVRHDILNAVDFGVPQQRERVILVGMKGENNYIFPVPTHGPGKKPYVTLKDAIGDLPPLKSGESASHYAGVAENEFLRFVRAGAGQQVADAVAGENLPAIAVGVSHAFIFCPHPKISVFQVVFGKASGGKNRTQLLQMLGGLRHRLVIDGVDIFQGQGNNGQTRFQAQLAGTL